MKKKSFLVSIISNVNALQQESLALAEEDWGISVMTLCPKITAVERFGKSPPMMAPAIPQAENLKVFQDRVKNTGVYRFVSSLMKFYFLIIDWNNFHII